MSVTDAFKTFQDVVNADITHVREARTRRDLFKGAFGTEDDVKEVIASGSLARGTHKDPIHDVDVIVVFDQDEHPEGARREAPPRTLSITPASASTRCSGQRTAHTTRRSAWPGGATMPSSASWMTLMILTRSRSTPCPRFAAMGDSSFLKHSQKIGSLATPSS